MSSWLAESVPPARSGAPASSDRSPEGLPVELTSFIGREHELEQVRELLGATRLLTLTGAGGCGKTRLALETAAGLRGRFPDGIWWVELAPVSDPALVGHTVAETLGVRPLPGRDALDAAIMHISARRALLVLDNCEHLLEEAARCAEALLRGCPRLAVLATSRAQL
jgi:predicted ATPase